MTTTRLMALVLTASVVTVAVARTRPGGTAPDSRAFEVTGVVTAPVTGGRVMVAHDEIPGYMPAMTMPFEIGPDVPPALTAGDRVRFTLRVGEEGPRAEAIVVTGHDARVREALKTGAAGAARRLRKGDSLPGFTLTTETGGSFTADDLQGHRTVVTFIFTRCPVPAFCPLMVKRFQELQTALQNDRSLDGVQLVSITLDPGFDTPPVLQAYARALGASPDRWRFVTGQASEIARFASAFSIHVERNGVLLDHTLATAVIDADTRIVEIWRGNGWTAGVVLDVLRDLDVDATGA